jgi:hypothetical protein
MLMVSTQPTTRNSPSGLRVAAWIIDTEVGDAVFDFVSSG